MPIGRISLLLLVANFLMLSLTGLLPTGDGEVLRAGAELLSFTCSDAHWLNSWRVLNLTLGVPLIAAGIACYLLFGDYSLEELKRMRNGASVATACWMGAVACILLAFSYFPCNSFYNAFAEADGPISHRLGHALRELLTGSALAFNALYALFFCGASYCGALGLKLLRKLPAPLPKQPD
ncbi:hypothetical protein [Pseudomonas sp. PDM20]|uniref:hypothetical protein n=1 Tax=Pseudomonas sp. PDM20 TaxID=2769254 RepID=UPI00177B596E|nr:hypothetical protein [Pseudomonas sp. PDM20]MBD9683586.1 hypothetical protein [Pseudomonas sp. PDM20]